jgi:hypothetical protein
MHGNSKLGEGIDQLFGNDGVIIIAGCLFARCNNSMGGRM